MNRTSQGTKMEKTVKKSKNLRENEKEKIINIILKYKDILESKKTDAITLVEKNKVWEKVAEEFNSCSAHKRSMKQLKVFYKNAKSELKKEIARNRAEIFKTGGGQASSCLDENNPLLSVVVDQTFTIRNEYDSSHALFNDNIGESIGSPSVVGDLEENVEDSSEVQEQCETPISNENSDASSAFMPMYKKRKRENQQINKRTAKIIEEIAELKKKKLEAGIDKNKAKTELYKKKLEILNKMENTDMT